jgi:hypothetical protein
MTCASSGTNIPFCILFSNIALYLILGYLTTLAVTEGFVECTGCIAGSFKDLE